MTHPYWYKHPKHWYVHRVSEAMRLLDVCEDKTDVAINIASALSLLECEYNVDPDGVEMEETPVSTMRLLIEALRFADRASDIDAYEAYTLLAEAYERIDS